jgi:hypothetical protein
LRQGCDGETDVGSGKTKARLHLTARSIEALRSDAAPYRVTDARVAGLALRVAADGGKTWDLSYRIKGVGVRRLSLGRYSDVSLEAARVRALGLTGPARQGVDLIAQERRAREDKAMAMTVGALVDLYLARRIKGRLRSAIEVERTLKRVLAQLASTPAADVRKRDLALLFESIAATGHERAAGKARQTVGAMFKWAASFDIVSTDPTRGLPSYDQGSARARARRGGDTRILDLARDLHAILRHGRRFARSASDRRAHRRSSGHASGRDRSAPVVMDVACKPFEEQARAGHSAYWRGACDRCGEH